MSRFEDFAFFESNVRFEQSTEFFDQIDRERRGVPQGAKPRVIVANSSGKFERFEAIQRWEEERLLDLKVGFEMAPEGRENAFPDRFNGE